MSHRIDHELLQKLVNYLANRPYNEVAQLISSLASLEELPIKRTKPTKDKK